MNMVSPSVATLHCAEEAKKRNMKLSLCAGFYFTANFYCALFFTNVLLY